MANRRGGIVRVPRGDQAVSLVIEIGLIGFAWWYLKLAPLFAGSLLALAIVSEFLAVGWSRMMSGMGLIGLGLLARSYYGQPMLGTVLSVLGVAMAVIGAIQLRGVMAAKQTRDTRE